MGSATCLDTNQACRNFGEKLQNFASPKLTFNDDVPNTIDAVHLKNVLRQIKPFVAIGSMDGSPHVSVSKRPHFATKLRGGAVHHITSAVEAQYAPLKAEKEELEKKLVDIPAAPVVELHPAAITRYKKSIDALADRLASLGEM